MDTGMSPITHRHLCLIFGDAIKRIEARGVKPPTDLLVAFGMADLDRQRQEESRRLDRIGTKWRRNWAQIHPARS